MQLRATHVIIQWDNYHLCIPENIDTVQCWSLLVSLCSWLLKKRSKLDPKKNVNTISSCMVQGWMKRTQIALCCYPLKLEREKMFPHVKMEIGNLIQITTTTPIFQQSHYFRQKYLEIASWAVSLLNNIWVQVEHSPLQQLNLQIINCCSGSLQAGCE